jgi:hypothetical protein
MVEYGSQECCASLQGHVDHCVTSRAMRADLGELTSGAVDVNDRYRLLIYSTEHSNRYMQNI